jgi:hypothetical protein
MIHASAGPRTLGVVRVAVFSIWLFTIAAAPFREIAELPMDLFVPIGLVRQVPPGVLEFIFRPVTLEIFKWTLATGLLLSALGARPYRGIAVTTVLLLTFQQGMARGFGHVNHGNIPLLLAAWILAIVRADGGFSPESNRSGAIPSSECALALQTMTVVLLLTYVFTGANRIANSVPEIFLNGTMTRYIAYLAVCTAYRGMRFENALLESSTILALLNVGFIVITLLEVLSLFCLHSRRFRWAWLATMIPFHFLTLFFMNIFFWQNLLLFPLLLGDISKSHLFKRRTLAGRRSEHATSPGPLGEGPLLT